MMETETRRGEFLPAFFLLMAAAFALYAGSFGHAWTYDDFPVIVDNPDIRSVVNFLRDSYPGRPLREITFLLDHALFGLEPPGWHFQNIFWHGLNAFLVLLLARRLQESRLVAWGAALLFLVHPLQVEVVANISHRKDSLALAFSLLALLAYGEVFRSRRRWLWVAAAFALAGIAYTGKQNAVLLPILFILWEWASVPPESRLLLRYRLPVLLLFLTGSLAASALLWGEMAGLPAAMRDILTNRANFFGEISAGLYYGMVLKSWAFMFLKLLLPVNLAVEYTYPVPGSWWDPWVLAALSGLLLYGLTLRRTFRSSRTAFLALVAAGVFWLPVSNLWPLSYFAADRYLYAPSAWIFLLTTMGVERVTKNRKAALAVLGGLFLLLVPMTWQQNKVWRSPETLWARASEVSPQSSFALNNMGNIFLLRGDLRSALAYYQRSAEANPLNPTAHYNLGLICEKMGDRTSARAHFERFLALDHPFFREEAKALREHLKRL